MDKRWSEHIRLLEGRHILVWVGDVRLVRPRKSLYLDGFRDQLDAPDASALWELPGCILQL